MRLRLIMALPIVLAFAGCSEEIQAQDSPTQAGETNAGEPTEAASTEGEGDAADIELRSPVGLD